MGGACYVGSHTDETGTLELPPVTLLDAMAAFETGRWRRDVTASKLTDEI